MTSRSSGQWEHRVIRYGNLGRRSVSQWRRHFSGGFSAFDRDVNRSRNDLVQRAELTSQQLKARGCLTLAEGRPYNLTIHTLKFELAF